MLRSLVLIVSLLFSGLSFAAAEDYTGFFTPSDGDYSIYIISKIFGDVDQNVLPGEAAITGSQLMGNVFRIFNQVALAVGVLMVLYTLVLATLNTAHHGKMFGEKMSSMWTAVRIPFAIAMLVPKANGYCLAQVVVMWLVVQGIGAADTVWSSALDYFEGGGSIGAQQMTDEDLNTSLSAVYTEMLDSVLISATCVATHNTKRTLSGSSYEIYTVVNGNDHYLKFGKKSLEKPSSSNLEGAECGFISLNEFSPADFTVPQKTTPQEEQDSANLANAKQMEIVYSFAMSLSYIADNIAAGYIEENSDLTSELDIMYKASLSYVSAMTGNQAIFAPPKEQPSAFFASLRDQGWITAGNYYQVLSTLKADLSYIPGKGDAEMPTASPPNSNESSLAKPQLEQAQEIYDEFMAEIGSKVYSTGMTPSQQIYEDIDKAMKEEASLFSDIGVTGLISSQMKRFIDMISGGNGTQDPVLQAAQYGQGLMKASIGTMIGLVIIFPTLSLALNWCSGYVAVGQAFDSMVSAALPFIYGLTTFLYTQGMMLGLYLPMVPFIIFAMGAIGWMFAVVESMVAAPLIAVGMTMPDERNEIYGRAEPALMLLFNMFMRPSLMVVGLLAAMLVAWVAMDLINLSFFTAVDIGGLAADLVIGPYVMVFMYMGVVVTLVTKVFGLINQVPDRVLRWIGDNTAAGEGSPMAEAAMSSGRQGGQEMSGQGTKSAQQGAEMSQKGGQNITSSGHGLGAINTMDSGTAKKLAGAMGGGAAATAVAKEDKKRADDAAATATKP